MLVGPPASAARTLVDDDREQCVGAAFSSTSKPSPIQAAVNVAQPGDLIRVCPGEYEESVMASLGLVSELDNDSLWKVPVGSELAQVREERKSNARDLINASIDHNSTFRNGVGLEAAGPGRQDQLTFANNVSREDGTSIAIQNSNPKGSRIVDNELSPSLRYGISVGGTNEDLEIARNVVTTGQNAIFFHGATSFIDQFTGPTTNTMVTDNTVTNQRDQCGTRCRAPAFAPPEQHRNRQYRGQWYLSDLRQQL
jgi:hypothetical protein